jgi:hypothetical protein
MSEQDRVLRRAFELQAEEEAQEQEALEAERLRVAVQDVGLDPAYLTKAEQDLEQAAVRRKKARRSVLLAAASLVAAVGLAAGAVRVLDPPAPAPWVSGFDQAGAWSLDVNPGTKTELRFEDALGRGKVAVVEVEQFAVEPGSAFRTNLQSSAVPNDLSRYDRLVLDVKGDLPAARIELQTGRSERWISAPVPASSQWKTHRLALEDFQHQVYEGGRWMTLDDKPPESISRISISLGDGVNAAGASGKVAFDNLKIE